MNTAQFIKRTEFEFFGDLKKIGLCTLNNTCNLFISAESTGPYRGESQTGCMFNSANLFICICIALRCVE